eukprot:TRINITY_DN419_c1_g1_i1.p1 TRINITY_DN419_c1_g1~~TRINITY_DN419_c1_g1_i1.p1  ORF type:complete len:1100 (+),score=345.18 TRINITY_DN419_c1_g1_i1:111-3410(+)
MMTEQQSIWEEELTCVKTVLQALSNVHVSVKGNLPSIDKSVKPVPPSLQSLPSTTQVNEFFSILFQILESDPSDEHLQFLFFDPSKTNTFDVLKDWISFVVPLPKKLQPEVIGSFRSPSKAYGGADDVLEDAEDVFEDPVLTTGRTMQQNVLYFINTLLTICTLNEKQQQQKLDSSTFSAASPSQSRSSETPKRPLTVEVVSEDEDDDDDDPNGTKKRNAVLLAETCISTLIDHGIVLLVMQLAGETMYSDNITSVMCFEILHLVTSATVSGRQFVVENDIRGFCVRTMCSSLVDEESRVLASEILSLLARWYFVDMFADGVHEKAFDLFLMDPNPVVRGAAIDVVRVILSSHPPPVDPCFNDERSITGILRRLMSDMYPDNSERAYGLVEAMAHAGLGDVFARKKLHWQALVDGLDRNPKVKSSGLQALTALLLNTCTHKDISPLGRSLVTHPPSMSVFLNSVATDTDREDLDIYQPELAVFWGTLLALDPYCRAHVRKQVESFPAWVVLLRNSLLSALGQVSAEFFELWKLSDITCESMTERFQFDDEYTKEVLKERSLIEQVFLDQVSRYSRVLEGMESPSKEVWEMGLVEDRRMDSFSAQRFTDWSLVVFPQADETRLMGCMVHIILQFAIATTFSVATPPSPTSRRRAQTTVKRDPGARRGSLTKSHDHKRRLSNVSTQSAPSSLSPSKRSPSMPSDEPQTPTQRGSGRMVISASHEEEEEEEKEKEEEEDDDDDDSDDDFDGQVSADSLDEKHQRSSKRETVKPTKRKTDANDENEDEEMVVVCEDTTAGDAAARPAPPSKEKDTETKRKREEEEEGEISDEMDTHESIGKDDDFDDSDNEDARDADLEPPHPKPKKNRWTSPRKGTYDRAGNGLWIRVPFRKHRRQLFHRLVESRLRDEAGQKPQRARTYHPSRSASHVTPSPDRRRKPRFTKKDMQPSDLFQFTLSFGDLSVDSMSLLIKRCERHAIHVKKEHAICPGSKNGRLHFLSDLLKSFPGYLKYLNAIRESVEKHGPESIIQIAKNAATLTHKNFVDIGKTVLRKEKEEQSQHQEKEKEADPADKGDSKPADEKGQNVGIEHQEEKEGNDGGEKE